MLQRKLRKKALVHDSKSRERLTGTVSLALNVIVPLDRYRPIFSDLRRTALGWAERVSNPSWLTAFLRAKGEREVRLLLPKSPSADPGGESRFRLYLSHRGCIWSRVASRRESCEQKRCWTRSDRRLSEIERENCMYTGWCYKKLIKTLAGFMATLRERNVRRLHRACSVYRVRELLLWEIRKLNDWKIFQYW